MLVLTREIGQEIIIAGPATVKILSRKGRRVRVGIESDAHIIRAELAADTPRRAPTIVCPSCGKRERARFVGQENLATCCHCGHTTKPKLT